jgi:hypothetical protein
VGESGKGQNVGRDSAATQKIATPAAVEEPVGARRNCLKKCSRQEERGHKQRSFDK